MGLSDVDDREPDSVNNRKFWDLTVFLNWLKYGLEIWYMDGVHDVLACRRQITPLRMLGRSGGTILKLRD